MLLVQIAAEALDFYAAWTGITQTLPKFDLAAVPGRGGAMENWGLLLFDEDRFLVNQVLNAVLYMPRADSRHSQAGMLAVIGRVCARCFDAVQLGHAHAAATALQRHELALHADAATSALLVRVRE